MSCGEQFTGFGWFDEINDNKLLYKNIEVIGK